MKEIEKAKWYMEIIVRLFGKEISILGCDEKRIYMASGYEFGKNIYIEKLTEVESNDENN